MRNPRTLARIRSLVIPPAWTDVWICAQADGHLQATGRDGRGRKQHRYHPDWTAARNGGKYGRMLEFGLALPVIRRRVIADLKKTPLSREFVLAAVVRMLEKTLIRIGNKEYARANNSFGLTTMLDEHVQVKGASLRFHFRAKSGVMQTIELNDRTLAEIVTTCRQLPGPALFQYVGSDGGRQKRRFGRRERVSEGRDRPAVYGKKFQDVGSYRSGRSGAWRVPGAGVGGGLQTQRGQGR